MAGTERGGVFVSVDDGTNWLAANAGLPAKTWIVDVETVGPLAFAATSGPSSLFLPDGREYMGGIFSRADRDGAWKPVNRGLNSTLITGLEAVGEKLFAATWSGVYISVDHGENWRSVGTGLPDLFPDRALRRQRNRPLCGPLYGHIHSDQRRRKLDARLKRPPQGGDRLPDSCRIVSLCGAVALGFFR
ncbi:MAG: hypothetical protein MZU84_09445 [Sphingobacterium sp.]|nr:hypothetical protein [Sphingobacterium sp.]